MQKIIKICTLLFVISIVAKTHASAQNSLDSIIHLQNEVVNDLDSLGGTGTVDVKNIITKGYGTYSLDNLQSFVGGYNGNIWGQAGLVLVDGVPRDASYVRMVEVQSVKVLKSGDAVALYGSNGAKGVILITTKKGQISPIRIDVRANSGLYVPKYYPKYLGAADYMTLYNEASKNDGIAEKYTQEQIYNTSVGVNPYKYPDIGFFNSKYLKKSYNKSDLTAEVYGGSESARYYTNIGLAYNNDILRYGYANKNNNVAMNLRANVDMNLSKWLSVSTSAVANFNNNYDGRGDFWGASATLRPNWFSPLIPLDMLDLDNPNLQMIVDNSNHLIDGKYLLGGTSTDQTNAFSDMLAAGYVKTKTRTFMFDVNAKADLGTMLKGLSFNAAYSMDYNDIYAEGYKLDYAVYEPQWTTYDGKDIIGGLTKYNNDKNSTNEYIGQTTYSQTSSMRAQFDYVNKFGKVNNVSATLLGWGYKTRYSNDEGHGGSTYQPTINTNLGLQMGYDYAQRYYFNFAGSMIHSAKLAPGHRNGFSPSFTLGWKISDEDFFKNSINFINYLKITAAYSDLKQDLDISDYYLYQGAFNNEGGWYQWRDGVAGGWTTGSTRGENLDLTFIDRKEYRVGLDAGLFNNMITLDANYFVQNTNGLLTQGASTLFPSYFSNWDFSFLPYLNYNEDRRSGLDFSVKVNKKIGNVYTSLGFSGLIYASQAMHRDEIYDNSYQDRAGRPLDAYWGYISEGFFQNEDEISSHATQSFGTVKPGDIKYKDVNNDGVIDSRDQVDLGHNGWAAAPFTFGLNLTLKWKNLTLFVLGSGNSGAIGFKNSSYYWVNGAAKYSDVVWGRWTEATKNTATYPRLTTTASSNNFQNSTFWLYKTNRFNLSRVQLTYDFDKSVFKQGFVRGLSVYFKGDDLLVFSKEHKMMETNIGSAPQYRFYNFGFKISF